jgi:hypothetical protein
MAFAGSNLALTTVTAPYARGGSLQTLNGVVYYTSGTNVSTGVVASLPLSLSSFFNKFTSSTGTLANQSNQTTASGVGNDVTCNVGFNTVSFTVTNGVLLSIALTFTQGHSQGGSAVSSGNNSFSASVVIDGNSTNYPPGGVNINGISGRTSLRITVFAQASNNLGIQTAANVNCLYNITPTGIILVSGP